MIVLYNICVKLTWQKSIPEGSHGSGTFQKRLWKVVSDFVRIRDFHEYKTCISCGKYFTEWQNANWQAGHYNPYSVCRGYSKFDLNNIFGQCSYCNRGYNGAPSGAHFKENILRRYGQERMDWLGTFQAMPSEKMDDYIVSKKIKEIIIKMGELPEQPEYYERVRRKEEFIEF